MKTFSNISRIAIHNYKSYLTQPTYLFFLAFAASIISRTIFLAFSSDSGIGWDELLYLKHAAAIISWLDVSETHSGLSSYFLEGAGYYRFFPPASPIGYAVFGMLFDNLVFGARIYNSLLVSIGIASSCVITYKLSKSVALSLSVVLISNIGLLHNAYSVFLWTEGAQFGLLSLMILISMGKLGRKQCIFLSCVILLFTLTHGSSLLIVLAFALYLMIFKFQPFSRMAIRRLSLITIPALVATVLLGLLYESKIGEFVLLTSESIPMRSLKNPPSTYQQTWKSIIELSNKERTSLSSASSSIAYDYLVEKGFGFFVERGWVTLKKSLEADQFPRRHYENGMWPFMSQGFFSALNLMNYLYCYMVLFGLMLFFFYSKSGLAFLLAMIASVKIVTIFMTGVASTRYFTIVYLAFLPFALVGIKRIFEDFRENSANVFSITKLSWASFIGTLSV
jgi:hypothetical protein